MAAHHFAILTRHEEQRESFYTYDAHRFFCVSVDMEALDPLLPEVSEIPSFFHEISRPTCGLNECGITLLPPASLSVLQDAAIHHGLLALSQLLQEAITAGYFVIHYGI